MLTVALTFDDGPSPWTARILDLLGDHGSRATFFVLGQQIRGRGDLLRRMKEEGHEIGMHGWDHTRIDTLSHNEMRGQIRLTRQAILNACGVTAKLWRSPWNDHSEETALYLMEREQLRIVGPNVEGFDCQADAKTIASRVLSGMTDQCIVSLHDGIAPNAEHSSDSRDETVQAVGLILERCRSVTVSELRDLG